jgi:hypothetical protein
MQAEPACEFLEMMKVLAYRRARLQPSGFRLRQPGAEFDLYELGRARHPYLDSTG